MLATQSGDAVTYTADVLDSVAYAVDEIRRLSTGSTWIRNGTTIGTKTTTLPSGAVPIVIGSGYANPPVYYQSYVDWIAVRKFVTAEPLAGTVQPSTTNRALSRPLNHADLMRAVCA